MGHHLHAHSPQDNPGQIVGIALASAVLGAVTALLLTPRSGSQTRREIRERLARKQAALRDRINHQPSQAVDDAEPARSSRPDQSGANESNSAQLQPKASTTAAKRTARKKQSDSDDWTDDIRRNGEH